MQYIIWAVWRVVVEEKPERTMYGRPIYYPGLISDESHPQLSELHRTTMERRRHSDVHVTSERVSAETTHCKLP